MLNYKSLILILLTLGISSCVPNNKIPDRSELTNLIVETIRQDTLDTNIPIDLKLEDRYNYQLEFDKRFGYLPPPPHNKKGYAFVFGFYKSEIGDSLGFNAEDSIFVADQINKNTNILLDAKQLPRNIHTYNSLTDKEKGGKRYKFLIPLVNRDKTFALVEYEISESDGGYSCIVFFRKNRNEWSKMMSHVQ
jgi:hypothetical protein